MCRAVYTMVQLRWLWTCTLCLVTISVHPLPLYDHLPEEQLSSAVWRAFCLPIEITNRVFTTALLNPATQEFQTMYKEVTDLLEGIYNYKDHTTCPTNSFYGGVAAVTLSSGSVIANATIVFNTLSINLSAVWIYFQMNAPKVEPQTLQLILNYTTLDKVTETAVSRITTTTATMLATGSLTATTTTGAITTATTISVITVASVPTTTVTTMHTKTTAVLTTITMTTTTVKSTLLTTPTVTAAIPPPSPTSRAPLEQTSHTESSTAHTITNTTTKIKAPTTTTTTVLTSNAPTLTATIGDSPAAVSNKTITSSDQSILATATKTNDGIAYGKHPDPHGVSTRNPNDSLTSGGGSIDGSRYRVPGLGIALLVLTSAILLLLMVIFIMMVRCQRKVY